MPYIKKDGTTLVRKTFTFDGKRETVYGETEEKAIENRAIRKKELEEGKKRITKNMLCKDWVEIFMKTYREPCICTKSYEDEWSLWNVHVAPHLKNLTLCQIKPLHCRAVLNQMAKAGRRKKHVLSARAWMKMMFLGAIENNLLISNPAENLKLPDCEDNESYRAITDEERDALLKACDALPYPDGLWARIMLYCGTRPDEPSRIYGKHIDIENARLFIDGTKTEKAKRWVPIPAILLSELSPYVDEPDKRVLNNKAGGKINKTNRKRMWNRLRMEMHVILGGERIALYKMSIGDYLIAEDFVPYCLRHTFCTDLCKMGVILKTAAELMGHTTTVMVDRIYTHVDDELLSDAARKMNTYHDRKTNKNRVIVQIAVKNRRIASGMKSGMNSKIIDISTFRT